MGAFQAPLLTHSPIAYEKLSTGFLRRVDVCLLKPWFGHAVGLGSTSSPSWGEEIEMTSRVRGLGHIGFYVQDLDKMMKFYRDFLGMTITKISDAGVFLSADPEAVDHEIALLRGRSSLEQPSLINQISMRVETLDDLRDFHRRIQDEGYDIDRIVSHCSAIGCYFRDPEGNPTEVFWLTGLPSWAIIAIPIDIERPDEEVLEDVRRDWETVRHLQVGERADAETVAAIRRVSRGLDRPEART